MQQQQQQQYQGYPAAPPRPVVVVPQQQYQYPSQYPAAQPRVQYLPGTVPAPVQYVPVQPSMVPVQGQTVMPPQGEYVPPSHNLILTVVVTVICALGNISSLMIGAPALICAVMAYSALKQQRYSTTKSLGYTAAVLSVLNIAYTGVVTIVIVGVAIGCAPRRSYYDYYYYYNNC